jgi:drug/metabolite transporter (DMT)-like permease
LYNAALPIPSSYISLIAAASWGAADFNGGLATRRAPVIPVGAITQLIGCAFMTIMAVAFAEPWLSGRALGFSVLAGAGNALGITALYRSLSLDKMGIGAPVAAVITAALPVVVSIAGQGWPSAWQLAGFALALLGIWLLAKPAGAVGFSRGLRDALLAGLGFSTFLVLIKYAGTGQAFWPVAISRATSASIIFGIGLASQAHWSSVRGESVVVFLAGVLDATGSLLFILASHHARLDVAAVLASLYPAATVILARLVLKERLSATQTVGMLAALTAVPLIAT